MAWFDSGSFSRLLKIGVSVREPALRGSGGCSHTGSYAALPPSPRALADGPILVFQHPVREWQESFTLDKSAESSQFFFDLLEYRPDSLCQGFHFIRADMIRVNIPDNMPKPSVRIELLSGFL